MTICSRTLQDVVATMTRDSSALSSDSEFDSDIESASDIPDGPSLPETTRTQENDASSDREQGLQARLSTQFDQQFL